jgi:uncharacterized membrane protein YccC
MLSGRAKESIKTALAMTIAYGIALSLDWDKPMWAGFAVAFVSLSSSGQSLNKAALRMVGTLIAVVVSLSLIALFVQDRWLFIVFIIAWVGFCTYRMSGPRHQYLWHVAGFATVIICLDAGADPVNAFDTAVLRTQETGLGILVYGVISVLLWPSNSRADFDAAVVKLAAVQHKLYRVYHDLMLQKDTAADVQAVRAEAVQAQTQFDQLLLAAKTDSYEVWELRRQWGAYQGLSSEIAEVLEHWRESFDELQTLDLHTLLPNLEAFDAEMEQRFVQIGRMLDNQFPEYQPAAVKLELDMAGLEQLSHFHKAALTVTRSRARRLETLTRSLFDCVSDIKGHSRQAFEPQQADTLKGGFIPDPERLLSAFRIMLVLWIGWLTLLYVEGIPGGSLFIMMATPIGMALSTMPQVSAIALFKPAMTSVLVAGLVYIFVMPQLSSFVGLGILIFAFTFTICYRFAAPQQGLGRAFGLAMFVVVIGVSNQQSYSFIAFANTAMVLPIVFSILMLTAYIPWSPLPERVFLRLLARFFRSAEFLISTFGHDPQQALSVPQRWRKRFHAHELMMLPGKLGVWGKMINPRLFPGTDEKQIQALVLNLQALSYRISGLVAARQLPQADFLVQELTQDMRKWRLAMQALFQDWSGQAPVESEQALEQRLENKLSELEARISETFEQAGEGRLREEDYRNFYRLLGGFRGVSEAMVSYARLMSAMKLDEWRETRFG